MHCRWKNENILIPQVNLCLRMTTLNTLILKSPEQTTKIKMAERGPTVFGRQSFAQMKIYSKARRVLSFSKY